LYHNVL